MMITIISINFYWTSVMFKQHFVWENSNKKKSTWFHEHHTEWTQDKEDQFVSNKGKLHCQEIILALNNVIFLKLEL